MLRLIELILACWRLSSLIVFEDGPFDIFGKLRNAAGVRYTEDTTPYGTNVVSEAMTCLWCTSVWVALLLGFARMVKPGKWLVRWLSISAGAIVLDEALTALGKKQV